MPAVRIAGILCCVLAAACASVKDAPPLVLAQTGILVVDPSLVGPNPYGAATLEPQGSAAKQAAPVAPAPSLKTQNAARDATPLARAPAKVSSPAAAIPQPRQNQDLPPAARIVEPPLDVAALKVRLRDTKAIGVFTKLALKNQVDDLLNRFRAHYQGGQKTSVATLRQPYDLLLLKVLVLVQDSDPPLARTILGSREAIWGILADPEKFKSAS